MGLEKGITQRGSKQWEFDIDFQREEISSGLSLKAFARQNQNDKENFSCGIRIITEDKKTTLSRYNGSNHQNDVANFECHIHHATADSIERGDRNPEHENTKVTDRYADLNGAFRCLCEDYNINKKLNNDQLEMFDWELQ